MNARSAGPIVSAILLPLTAVTLFSPFYQTNDDVTMRLLAEGHFVPGGKPVPFLLFINIVIGKMLAAAYALMPGVPWYDLVLGASLTAAAAALVVVWIGSGERREILWTVILTVFFLLPAFVSVQFSIVGLTCSAAGIALLLHAALEPVPRRLHAIVGTALFVWGSLIRFEGAVLMAIEGAVLALPLLFGARSRWRALLLPACAAAVLMMSFFAADRVAYNRSGGWSRFHEFDNLRRRGVDYLVPEQITPSVLARLHAETGWSENDFLLFSGWYFTDPAVYSMARARKAAEIFGSQMWTAARVNAAARDAGTFLIGMRWTFLLLGLFVLARGPSFRLSVYFFAATLMVVMLVGVVSVISKTPPPRVYWPMLILAATMLTIAARRVEPAPGRWMPAIAAILGLFVAAHSLPTLHRTSEVRRVAAANARRDVAELRRIGARLFIIHGNAFPYEDYWQPLHPAPPPFAFIALGLTDQTPPVQDALRETASVDVAWSLCSDPRLILIAWDPIPPMLSRYVLEHRGAAVRFEPVFRGKCLTAWRCRRWVF
jgi:hypothetical protein